MNDFSIITRLTIKEYTKIMIVGLYKKPKFILSTVLGLYFIITVVLNYLGIIKWYTHLPIFEICCGIFLLIIPILIALISVQQFKSNKNFQNDITYIFTDNSIICQALTFKKEFLWADIIRQKEFGKFLILYVNNKFGYFIDKTKLTIEQLNFIKHKVEKNNLKI